MIMIRLSSLEISISISFFNYHDNKCSTKNYFYNLSCHTYYSIMPLVHKNGKLLTSKIIDKRNCAKTIKYNKNASKSRHLACNLQSHVACWHIKMWTLIRHTICEIMVKIYNTSDMNDRQLCLKITQKTTFHNLQLHLALIYWYIKMYILIRHTFCESLVKVSITKNKWCSCLCYFFQT